MPSLSRLGLLFGLIVVQSCACGGRPPVNQVRLEQDVQVLDAAMLQQVKTFDGATGVLEVDPSLTLQPGTVIVGGLSTATPLGVLRRVKSVTSVGGLNRVETEFASLDDVVAEGRIELEQPYGGDTLAGVQPLVDGVAPLTRDQQSVKTPGGVVLGLNDVVIADVDGDKKTKDDQVRLTASLSMEPKLKMVFDFSLEEGIEEVSASLQVKTALTARMVAGAGVTVSSRIPLAKLTYVPIVLDVGFPLVFVPELELVVGAEGAIGVKLVSEAVAAAEVEIGVGYIDDEWQPITKVSTSSTTTSAAIAGNLQAKVYAGPELQLFLYGVIGPYMNVRGYAKLDASTEREPCFQFSVGASSNAGVDLSAVSILGVGLGKYDTELFDVPKPIFTAECDPSLAGLNPDGATFGRSFSGAKALEFRDAVTLSDGSLVFVSKDPDGAYLTKVRPDGSMDFHRFIAGTFGPKALALGVDGRLWLAGTHGGLSPWVARFDLEGNVLWSQLYAPTVSGVAALVVMDDGGVIVGGTYGFGGADYDEWLMRLDAHGAVLWSKGYSMGSELTAMRRLGDGVVVVGLTSDGVGTAGHVTRIDGSGAVAWNTRFNEALQYLYGVDVSPSSSIAAVGSGIDGAAFIRLSADGAVQASVLVSNRAMPFEDYGFRSVRWAAQGFIAVGQKSFGSSGEALGVQFAADATPVWAATFGGSDEDLFSSVAVVGQSGWWGVGTSESFGSQPSVFAVRASSTGQAALANGAARVSFTGNFDRPGTDLGGGVVVPQLGVTAISVSTTNREVTPVTAAQNELPTPVPMTLVTVKLGSP